jgi:hypothetical protein
VFTSNFNSSEPVLKHAHYLYVLAWLQKRELTLEWAEISAEELNKILRKYYAEVRNKNGALPKPQTLRSLRAAIHRHLTQPPFNRSMKISDDKEFQSANAMLESRCKAYFQSGQGEALKHHPSIAHGDMVKLGEYFDRNNPDKLVEMICFFLCFHFGRRGREGWRKMSKNTFEVRTDDAGARYLAYSIAEQTKNWQGNSSKNDTHDARMYENLKTPNPNLEPVSTYLFYLTKLHPECDTLFQTPLSKYRADRQ